MAISLSLSQLKNFVTSAEGMSSVHDQVRLGEDGSLNRIANTSGSKIQRFFSAVSSEGSEQVAKNRQIRNAVLSAIKNETGGVIPDGVKDLLKKSGFDISKPGAIQSYKSLSSRAIRAIVAKVEEINAADRAHLLGDTAKVKIASEPALAIVDQLKKLPKGKYVSDALRGKIEKFLDCMIDASANSNKIVRTAYLLTKGLSDVTAAALGKKARPPEPVAPEEPDSSDAPKDAKAKGYPIKPEKPFFCFFGAGDKYNADLAAYYKDIRKLLGNPPANMPEADKKYYAAVLAAHDYDADKAESGWEARCKAIDEANMKPVKAILEKITSALDSALAKVRVGDVEAADINNIEENFGDVSECEMQSDLIMQCAHTVCEETEPGLFEGTIGAGLDDLDTRLRVNFGTKVDPPVTQSQSTRPLSTVSLDLQKLITSQVLPVVSDYATVRGVEVVKVNDGSLKLKLAGVSVKCENLPETARGLVKGILPDLIKSLEIPLHFKTDNEGVLAVVVGKAVVSDSPLISGAVDGALSGIIPMLAEKFGPSTFVGDSSGKALSSMYALGDIKELSVKGSTPVEVTMGKVIDKETNKKSIFELKIDPSKLEPLKELGFAADTKFRGVKIDDGRLIIQAGGANDEIAETEIPKAGMIGAHVNLGGLEDRVKHLLRSRNVTFGSLQLTTDAKAGTVSVSMMNFDATAPLKDVKGLLGVGARLFAKGSFKLNFKPTVNPQTGDVTLSIAGVESLGGVGNWMKKRLLNTFMRTVANFALSGNDGIQVADSENPNDPLTLKLKPSELVPSVSVGGSVRKVKPVAITVTDKGLAVGMDIYNQSSPAFRKTKTQAELEDS